MINTLSCKQNHAPTKKRVIKTINFIVDSSLRRKTCALPDDLKGNPEIRGIVAGRELWRIFCSTEDSS